MVTRIDELPETNLHSLDHVFPAMKDGLTVKLTVQQVLDLVKVALVNQAPETLDTLNELATALGDDPDFSATVLNSLATKLTLSGDFSDLTGHARKIVAINNTETGAELVPPGTRIIRKNILSDDTMYSTESQTFTVFKEYLIEETQSNSRLLVHFKTSASPTGGDNGDSGCEHLIKCCDLSENVITDGLGQILEDVSLLVLVTSSTGDYNDIYSTVNLILPELPQNAKIDLTSLGGSGYGWRIQVLHREYYNCTQRSSNSRLEITEIEENGN